MLIVLCLCLLFINTQARRTIAVSFRSFFSKKMLLLLTYTTTDILEFLEENVNNYVAHF